MKRIVILSMLLVMGLFATAQTVVLSSAVEACNRGFLDKARKLIDMACNNEETKNDAKTWYYAGLIYSRIGMDPQKSASAPDWCAVASNAIQKCIQLDNEGEYKKECKQINNDIKKYCGQNISSSNTPEIKTDPSTIKKDENTNSIQSEVSLVVSADGKSKTEAVNNALRSAIEQTFGTFVSANTEILNDQLVKEEIATVSSGNIQKYTEVTTITLPNGNVSVTLNVTVSLSKLVSYAQSKGSECEFAGATFGANLKMYEFHKKSEQLAIQNLIKQLNALRPVYDYELLVSDPVLNSGNNSAKVDIVVKVLKNEKTNIFYKTIIQTLTSLAMSDYKIAPMFRSGFDFHRYYLCLDGNVRGIDELRPFYFYSSEIEKLDSVIWGSICDVSIKDNNDNNFIATLNPLNISGQIGHRCYGRNGYYDWAYIRYNRDIGGYFENRKIVLLNTNDIVWIFPTLSFDIPLGDIYKLTKISATPSKTNPTISFNGNYQNTFTFKKNSSY